MSACVTAAFIDGLRDLEHLDFAVLGASVGLAVSFGAAAGACTAAVGIVASSLPAPARALPWLVLIGLYFAQLAADLGAVANLGTRHHGLAVVALAGSAGATVGLTAVATATQSRARRSSFWLADRGVWFRRISLFVMVSSAAGAAAADHLLLPDLYPEAHLALKLSALFLVAVAIRVNGYEPPASPLALAGLAALGLALSALPFVLLDEAHPARVSEVSERPYSGLMLDIERTFVDVDADGFASVLGGGDCAPLNRRVSPGAVEIPDNGIDDNCLGGDAASTPAEPVRELVRPTEPAPMDVVLITVDALRADAMSAYGAERNTTPNIKRWAEHAQRFDAAYTPGLWTTIALPALMHGMYARRLEWTLLYKTTQRTMRATDKLRPKESVRARFVLPLDDSRRTIAEHLAWRGMHTVAVVDDGFTLIFEPEWGFGRGFDEFVRVSETPGVDRNDAGTAGLAIQHFEAPRSQPLFMWVHFFGPHKPDETHPEIESFGTTPRDRYDHEVAFLDAQLGRFLDAIERSPRPVAVVLTADHGEFIHDRGRSHGTNGSNANVQIPLFLRAPGVLAGNSTTVATSIDVAPTVYGLTNTPLPGRLDGLDLRELMDNPRAHGDRVVFSDSFIVNKRGAERFRFDLAAAMNSRAKLVMRRESRTTRLVQLDDEPIREGVAAAGQPLQQAIEHYLEETGGTPTFHR